MRVILSFLFLALFIQLFGQNRIPSDGENIIFYPLNENNAITAEGYDCFYDKVLVAKNGKYKFKPKFRFNRNEDNTTSSDNIEGYTFNVLNHEILDDNTEKEVLLLFLRRNEDGKEIVMRVPWHTDNGSNRITQSFRKYKRKDPYSLTNTATYVYLNLPFVNADSVASIKQQFDERLIVFDRVYSKEYENRTKDFDIIVKDINEGEALESHKVYKCTDIGFRNIYESDIYNQLCASVTDDSGKTFTIPVAYFVGNNNMTDPNNGSAYYFFNLLFKERDNYLFDMYKEFGCERIVNKYSGNKVYYGLKEIYIYDNAYNSTNADENRRINDMALYKINEGLYDCLGFDIQNRFEKGYSIPIPFAILKDKEGVSFRVPAVSVPIGSSYYYNRNNCKRFDQYFMLKEEADSIKEQNLKHELEYKLYKKNKLHLLSKKFGKSYADILVDKDEKTIERFSDLAKKYGKSNAMSIVNGVVKMGWNKTMCKEAWGAPDRINTTTGIWGVHEQWVYEYEYSYNNSYLYFENGVLTTIQE